MKSKAKTDSEEAEKRSAIFGCREAIAKLQYSLDRILRRRERAGPGRDGTRRALCNTGQSRQNLCMRSATRPNSCFQRSVSLARSAGGSAHRFHRWLLAYLYFRRRKTMQIALNLT